MSYVYAIKCKDCGNVISVVFGITHLMCYGFKDIFKEKFGDRAYEQFAEILYKCERGIDFNIEDYDCFEIERIHDLDYKIKRLTFEKKSEKEKLDIFKKMYKDLENLSKKDIELKDSIFNDCKVTIKEIEEALESEDSKDIDAIYKKVIPRPLKDYGYTVFICSECGNLENEFYTRINSDDYTYAIKTRCPKCNAKMISYRDYDNSFNQAIEEGYVHCQKCGSDKFKVYFEEHED